MLSSIDCVDHFPTREFTCPAFYSPGGYHACVEYPLEWRDTRLPVLKRLLERIRLACGGHPVTVLSGYRTVEYDAELRRRGLQGERHASGVTLPSQNTEGRAADIQIFGVETVVVLQTVRAEYDRGHLSELGGVGYYPSWGFVHVDTFRDGGHLRRWNG